MQGVGCRVPQRGFDFDGPLDLRLVLVPLVRRHVINTLLPLVFLPLYNPPIPVVFLFLPRWRLNGP